jgi:hypothetical protein
MLVGEGILDMSVAGKGFLVENNVENALSLISGFPASLLVSLVALATGVAALLFHSKY